MGMGKPFCPSHGCPGGGRGWGCSDWPGQGGDGGHGSWCRHEVGSSCREPWSITRLVTTSPAPASQHRAGTKWGNQTNTLSCVEVNN